MNRILRATLFLASLTALLSGCQHMGEQQDDRYQGQVVKQQDQWLFLPCDTDERWVLSGPAIEPLATALADATLLPGHPAAVTMEGETYYAQVDRRREARLHATDFSLDDDSQAACTLPAASLTNTFWRLTHLGEQPLEHTADNVTSRAPHVVFMDNGRLRGSTGCNSIMGSVDIKGSALRTGVLATTKMACYGIDERPMADALSAARDSVIDGQVMTLLDEQGVPLASFEAAYLY